MSLKQRQQFQKENKTKDEFIFSYWAVRQVHDPRQANATKEMKQIPVEVGSDVYEINVPVITNPDGVIKAGMEIVALKQDMDEETDEPEPKQHRAAKPTAKGKGNGTDKRAFFDALAYQIFVVLMGSREIVQVAVH